jgi:hypothetical protein
MGAGTARFSTVTERAIFLDDRGALRVTWHDDDETVVLSVWRGALCRATFRLTPEEAERLATFLQSTAALSARGVLR